MQRHFTATAFVMDSHKRVLLLWHKRLQRWMPPGGHVDAHETPEECARRECLEETGLEVDIVGDSQPDLFAGAAYEGKMLKRPFAMLLENIPASELRGEPAHEHMDFLYLAKPHDETQALQLAEEEAERIRWFSAAEIDALTNDEIFMNVRAYVKMLGSR